MRFGQRFLNGLDTDLRTFRARVLRHFRVRSAARPKWKNIIPSDYATSSDEAPSVLVATSTGSNWPLSGFESVLSTALRLRGCKVTALLCDGALSACQECDVRTLSAKELILNGAQALCSTCTKPAADMFSEAKIPLIYYGTFIGLAEKQEIANTVNSLHDEALSTFIWRDIPVGEHARAGALRYFGSGTLDSEPTGNAVLRRYLIAAMQSVCVMENLLSTKKFDRVVFHHGIYVPQGAIGDVCRKFGVRVINWNLAYRDRTVLFTHHDTYHRTMIAEPNDTWLNLPFSDDDEKKVLEYIKSRRSGSNDWISFQIGKSASEDAFEGLSLVPDKPIIGLLTNVMWDAQLHFKANAFESMVDWLYSTVDHFAARTDVQLLIRIHPAEVLGTVPSRQKVSDLLNRRYGRLPKNVTVIGPDDPRNTYLLMERCRAVLVYGTKMAIELPCLELPTVVAGEAWARNKGFTIDVSSKQEYFELLQRLPDIAPLTTHQIRLARQYAFYLFFRRMIPIGFAEKRERLVPIGYNVNSLSSLLPGADEGLDRVCDGIINLDPFIMGSGFEQ